MEQEIKNLVEEYVKGNIKNEYIPPLLSYVDNVANCKIDILTQNDITVLFGPSGCGKSRVAAYLVRQLLLEEPDKFFLRDRNNKKMRVIFIESEMSDYSLVKYFLKDNFFEYDTFHQAYKDLKLQNRYCLYPFNNLSVSDSLSQLKKIAANEIQNLNDYNIVFFIDNLGSFTEDLNSSTNNSFIKELKAILSEFTVLAVMHSNFKDEAKNKNNPTGALGSSAEKIAQTIIQVKPQADNILQLVLNKSKTQDDKKRPAIFLSYKEENRKIIFEQKSQSEYLVVKNINEQKNEKSNDVFITLSNMILNHFNKKPDNDVERLRQNLAYAFPDFLKKAAMYPKINKLVDDKILFYKGDYLFHKDEMPF